MSEQKQQDLENVSREDSPSDRRSFLRGAAVAAGAAATAGIATSANAQESLKFAPTAKSTLSVSFDARHGIKLYDLQQTLEQVLNQAGCPACGLVGLDIRLGLDPVLKIDTGVLANATMYSQHG